MSTIEARPRLYLIELEQKIENFGVFIGSWVYNGDVTFLVDPGPKASVGELLEGLKLLGIKRLDFIFLTHIHIDHAGGTGVLVNRFPGAKVVCHESGIPHLIDPRKLWEGSKKVLGDLALKYGAIEPVPPGSFLPPDEFRQRGFQVIRTPGHAPHHLSFIFNDTLFVGDAGGVYLNHGRKIYLRPITPPRFILEETVGSIDRLLETHAREICYAHFGIHSDAKEMLKRYKSQLSLWRDVLAEQMSDLNGKEMNTLLKRSLPILMERDGLFRSFKDLSEGDQARESHFLINCIQGISEYIAGASSSS